MQGHHFICYSSESLDFALRLRDELEAGPPELAAWLDKRDIRPGRDWDEEVVDAIRGCESLLFVMTEDSVARQSVCKREWTRALKYKKPIIPLLVDEAAEMPFRLEPRQYIRFSGRFRSGMARLRKHLTWLKSPDGVLQSLEDRQADAQRDLKRAKSETDEARIRDEIDTLESQIEEQKWLIEDPEGAARRAEESITRGLERERVPEEPERKRSRPKYINTPPGLAPTYFQDRFVETKLVGDLLRDKSKRLVTVVGRAGVGKTAMVCRVLKSLEGGKLPDNGETMSVDGIVYLSATGSRKVSFQNIFADLSRLLPDDVAARLDAIYRDASLPVGQRMLELLAAFPSGRTVLLLDNFEDLVDPETTEIQDQETDEALRTVLSGPHHGVKVVITTRVAPGALALVEPGRQARVPLEDGLESPYAENILREMDLDGRLGLKDAPAEVLDAARRRTLGYPRALEALFAILSADRHTSLDEILSDAGELLPENVVEVLVGEAYSRIDAMAQRILQALAVYARPVTAAAVDYLLQPHVPGIDSAAVLKRLVNMHFARREGTRYYLHPVDRAYASERVPRGAVSDREKEEAVYSLYGLLHRGAEYFREARHPRTDWKSIDDLAPQLAEFDLRCEGKDFQTAAEVLEEIDQDYLRLWGQFALSGRMSERVLSHLERGSLWVGRCMGYAATLGRMGRLEEAAEILASALEYARENGLQWEVNSILITLGWIHRDLGQDVQSIEYCEEALELSRTLGQQQSEATVLSNLANAYSDTGEIDLAIQHYKEALAIDRELGDRTNEALHLNNLAIAYGDLGQLAEAIECADSAQSLAIDTGYRLIECSTHAIRGDFLTDKGEFAEAGQSFEKALELADEINALQFQNSVHGALATMHLIAGRLDEALASVDRALEHRWPSSRPSSLAIRGVVQLRRGEADSAAVSFRDALQAASVLKSEGSRDYSVLECQGLARAGLCLLREADELPGAIRSYRDARSIHSGKGVIQRAVRMLDALAAADAEGLLDPVRAAAAGE